MSTIGRLTQRRDFLAAAGGRRFHTERLSAQGLLRGHAPQEPSAEIDGLRIGFTITKRVGHATERNRIRRRLRAAVLAVADSLPSPAADIVVVARRPALSAAFGTLVEDLRRAVPIVTKPQTRRDPTVPTVPRRGRGKAGAPASGAHPAIPLLASGPGAPAPPGRATAPSPIPNACDGPTDG